MSTIIDKSYVLFIKKGLLRKQNATSSAISKRWDYLTCPPPGESCETLSKTGIKLVIETTWTFERLVLSLAVASCVWRVYCPTGLSNSWVLKVYKKRNGRIESPLVRLSRILGVPLLCPSPYAHGISKA